MIFRVLCLLASCFPPLLAQDSPPAPDGARQDAILAKMHEYGDRYIDGLPNFLCEQVTRQFQSKLNSKAWKQGDTLVYTLGFHDGQEQRGMVEVNGKPIQQIRNIHWRRPLQTEGEFGALIATVLGQQSQASFSWNRWDNSGGRRLAVFNYSVDRGHSTKTLTLSDLASATLPYFGEIAADPDTGAVWKISDIADDIPAQVRTKTISTEIQYSEVGIGSKTYLLPAQAVVSVVAFTEKIRNELSFRNYRKFSSDSSITFDK